MRGWCRDRGVEYTDVFAIGVRPTAGTLADFVPGEAGVGVIALGECRICNFDPFSYRSRSRRSSDEGSEDGENSK